jgi:hypothetical protein
MPRTPLSPTLGDWIRLVDQVTPDDIAGQLQLEHIHAKLRSTLDEVQSLVVERDLHQAHKQEATRKIQELLDAGRRQATALRVTLKEHYGIRNEKLTAFGIQPFRGRKRAAKRRDPQQPDEPSK